MEPSGLLSAREGLKEVVGDVVGVLVPEDEHVDEDEEVYNTHTPSHRCINTIF